MLPRKRHAWTSLAFMRTDTLSASQEFSKGLVRPDPLLYLGSWRVGDPGKSA